MLSKLLPYAKKYALYAVLSPLCILGEVIIEVFIPLLMSVIIDCGINGADLADKNILAVKLLTLTGIAGKTGIELVIAVGALMVIMAVVSLIFGAAAARAASTAGVGFGAELRAAVFNKVQSFSFANIDKFSTGSLITRMTTDITTVQNTFMMIIRMCFRAPLMFIMAISFSININRNLSLVFIFVAPFLAAVMMFIGIKSFPRFRAMFKKYDRFNTSIQENLIGIRVVKAFVRSGHEKKKFADSNDELKRASVFAEKLIILNSPVMMLAIYACILSILWFGGKLAVAGSMTIGELMSFITYVQQILMSLMMISMIFVMTVMSRASIQRISEVLGETAEISDDTADPSLTVPDGGISMKNVCFKYDKNGQKNVLDDINLEIAPGEIIGIIGATGSAKTSLVQLIPRLYDTTSGSVCVGGHNVREYTVEHLRESVAMVLQNNVLFSGTIEDNLRWGDENASEETLRHAAETAAADGFIMSFPDKYQTDLGQGGVNVSGGQKQRLCIARALLKKPKILILDDSTSAVDTATDAKIREGFKGLPGTTVIIIAQRINSVKHADRIVVLEDGKIAAVGTHEQLFSDNEIYREICVSQQEGQEDNETLIDTCITQPQGQADREIPLDSCITQPQGQDDREIPLDSCITQPQGQEDNEKEGESNE